MADVEQLNIFIDELRSDQDDDGSECAGKLRLLAGDETRDLPRAIGIELGLDRSGRAGL